MSPKRTFSIPSTLIDTQTGTCLSRGRFISQPPLQISQHVTGSDQWALDHKTLLKGRDYALFLLSLLKILEQKFKQPSLPKKKKSGSYTKTRKTHMHAHRLAPHHVQKGESSVESFFQPWLVCAQTTTDQS